MKIPPADLSWFAENLSETVHEILDAWNDNGTIAAQDEVSPDLMLDALDQLIEVLRRYEWQQDAEQPAEPIQPAEQPDISELGEYGLSILVEFSQLAVDLGLEHLLERLELLALALAQWVVNQDGELHSIDLVVNAIARLANHAEDPGELEHIFLLTGQLLVAAASEPYDDPGSNRDSEANPWHLLLLNRAIIATRTLSPQLMDIAFADIAEQIPEQATAFFREGIEQVKLQEYPDEVREVIERYYRQWPQKVVLH